MATELVANEATLTSLEPFTDCHENMDHFLSSQQAASTAVGLFPFLVRCMTCFETSGMV